MGKTYIQLTPDRAKAHWKFEHGDECQPLECLYHPDIVALMVDVTGMDPQPEEGWLYDGRAFTPPPPLMKALPDRDGLVKQLRQLVLDKQTMTLLGEDTTDVEAAIEDLVKQIKEMDDAS